MLPANELLKKANAVVLRNDDNLRDDNVFYMLERAPCDDTVVLIIKENPVLLVSELEIGNYFNAQGVVLKQLSKKNLKRELNNLKGTIGINYEGITAAGLKRIKKHMSGRSIDISQDLADIREVKSDGEIKKISKSCKAALEILERVPEFFDTCKTEEQMASRMDGEIQKYGATNAFPTIVASGKDSAIPHYKPAKKKIGHGFLIVDFGMIIDGYHSDLTRTFFAGRPEEKDNEIFSSVMDAKIAATKECFAGNDAKNVHIAAEAIVQKRLGGKMMHSVGHGIGLRTHDFPAGLHGEAKFKLKKNMCVTIEPGYYKNGAGGVRLEDVVAIKKGKCREITKTEKDLHLII